MLAYLQTEKFRLEFFRKSETPEISSNFVPFRIWYDSYQIRFTDSYFEGNNLILELEIIESPYAENPPDVFLFTHFEWLLQYQIENHVRRRIYRYPITGTRLG